jgi:hypothetical protein
MRARESFGDENKVALLKHRLDFGADGFGLSVTPNQLREFWYRYEPRPSRSKEVLARFGIVLPKPKPRLPRVIEIGKWRHEGKEIHLTRAELFDRVWWRG